MTKGLEMTDEGENRAVRMFLALYGGQYGITAEQMCGHLKSSGFDKAWPDWAETYKGHLTKAGAQLWIRYLFSIEQAPVAWMDKYGEIYKSVEQVLLTDTPLYTSSPVKEFVCSTGLCHYRKPLTKDQ